MKRPIDYVFDAIESKIMTPFQKALALTGALLLVAIILLAVPVPEGVKERQAQEAANAAAAAAARAARETEAAATTAQADPAP